MNNTEYDCIAIDNIIEYFHKHGRYPKQIEATEDILKKMNNRKFYFREPLAVVDLDLGTYHEIIARPTPQTSVVVEVVPVGDSVFKRQESP